MSLAMQIIQMCIPGCSLIHNSSKYLHPLSPYFGLKYAKRMHRGCLSILQTLHFGQQKRNPTGMTAKSMLHSHLSGKSQTPAVKSCFKKLHKPKVCGRTFLSDLIFQTSFPSVVITQDKLTEMDSLHFLGSVGEEGRTDPGKTQTSVF